MSPMMVGILPLLMECLSFSKVHGRRYVMGNLASRLCKKVNGGRRQGYSSGSEVYPLIAMHF